MNLKTRVERLEGAVKADGYDLTLLTNAELIALSKCWNESGDFQPERMTPELEAAIERVKL